MHSWYSKGYSRLIVRQNMYLDYFQMHHVIRLPLKTKDKMIHNDKKNGPLRQGYFERRAVLRNVIKK